MKKWLIFLVVLMGTSCTLDARRITDTTAVLRGIQTCDVGPCKYWFEYWPTAEGSSIKRITREREGDTGTHTRWQYIKNLGHGDVRYSYRIVTQENCCPDQPANVKEFTVAMEQAEVAHVDISPIGDALWPNADKHNLQFGGVLHGHANSFATMATYGDYMYVPFVNTDLTLGLARRRINGTQWDTINFPDSTVPCNGTLAGQDSHDDLNIAITDDGVIHLMFGHHRNALRYRHSQVGAAGTDVFDIAQWDVPLNTALIPNSYTNAQDVHCPIPRPGERPYLSEAEGIQERVTYPQFLQTVDGLAMIRRVGQPTQGVVTIYKYLGNYEWSEGQPVFDGTVGTFETSPGVLSDYRSWYINTAVHDGVIHATGVLREASVNRPFGVVYARSDDGGVTWTNHKGVEIGSPGNPITIDSPDFKISDQTSLFMFAKITIGRDQTPHIVLRKFTGFFGAPTWTAYHYTFDDFVRIPRETFIYAGEMEAALPFIDKWTDTLYVVMNDGDTNFKIASAQRNLLHDLGVDNGWGTWSLIYDEPATYGGDMNGIMLGSDLFLLGQRLPTDPVNDDASYLDVVTVRLQPDKLNRRRR